MLSKGKPSAAAAFEDTRRTDRRVPGWLVALAWACMGFIGGCAIANFMFDTSSAGTIVKSSFKSLDFEHQGPSSRKSYWSAWADIDTIFSFGDSFTSSHFNVTQDPQPGREAPFGNRAGLPKDNQNDTSHWIHYLRDRYGQSEPVVYNLAKGGAMTNAHAFAPPKPGIATSEQENSFHGQIELFNRYNETRAEFRIYWKQPGNVRFDESRTLFVAWLGIVDLLKSIDRNRPLPTSVVLSAYLAGLERLYKGGARNFLMLNVPPVYKIYKGKAKSQGEAEADVLELNRRIAGMRDRFVRRHADVTFFLLDAFSLFNDAIADPSSFDQTARLRNTDMFCDKYVGGAEPQTYYDPACIFSIEEYFWLDEVHITPPVHDLVAATVVGDCFDAAGPKGFCS